MIKYPRTYHLPWSNMQSDDKMIKDLSPFNAIEEVVVLEKLDGESTTTYSTGYMHARSLDSVHNFTRDWVKRMLSVLRFDIPEGYRLSIENMAYFHSIEYKDLSGFAYLLSVWNEKNFRLSYDDYIEFAALLDLPVPKELYRGPFDQKSLIALSASIEAGTMEGYVVMNTASFHYDDFAVNVGKFVRKDHVQPKADHWLKNTYPNSLRSDGIVMPAFMKGANLD